MNNEYDLNLIYDSRDILISRRESVGAREKMEATTTISYTNMAAWTSRVVGAGCLLWMADKNCNAHARTCRIKSFLVLANMGVECRMTSWRASPC